MGEWIVYKKGTNPMELFRRVRTNNKWNLTVDSLYLTLRDHDIHAFFVEDVIHLMIYSLDGKVNGVFGYGPDLEVEEEYFFELKNKLIKFKNNQGYLEILNDMMKLSNVYRKYLDDVDLDLTDLNIIYEVNHPMKTFSGVENKKLNEILESRDKISDLMNIYNLKENEIALNPGDINEGTVLYVGNISITDENIEIISNLKYVIGYVYLENKSLKKDLHIKDSYGIEIR